ncbi:hypothetical protein GCM10010970_20600 [Silvimonas iriomotensis]|uniref:Uncharacterized protein n=1 Tax=Silvimonas iriomotensis TaxID=449662 RepID=A0ABQ2P9V1_9NEIS|nr:hypothetical protein GCM10010970_20600 [Silvimonas iriomotensis]
MNKAINASQDTGIKSVRISELFSLTGNLCTRLSGNQLDLIQDEMSGANPRVAGLRRPFAR